jgi:hypothetical protein
MKLKHFTVQGRGYFPLDMLRHDCCWPTTSSDAAAMAYDPRFESDRRAVRTVNLSYNIGTVTDERWRSFGWIVTKEPK